MKYILIILVVLSLLVNEKSRNDSLSITSIEYIKLIRNDSVNVSWSGKYNLLRTIRTSKFLKGNELINKTVINGGVEFKPNNVKGALFKNYESNEMYSEDLIGFKFFNIKDSINIIKWSIKSKQKDILGYACTLAEASFRGRVYEAWFTTELISGGPWKLDGLPGMILKADTKDGYLSYEASKIVITNKEKTAIDNSNPYALEKKFYSWDEFKKLYKDKALGMSKFNPEDNTSFVAPMIKKERYIEANDPDYLKRKNKVEDSFKN